MDLIGLQKVGKEGTMFCETAEECMVAGFWCWFLYGTVAFILIFHMFYKYRRDTIFQTLGKWAWLTFPAAVVTLVAMNVVGPAAKPLDLMFTGYGGQEAYDYLTAMGADEVLRYQYAEAIDLLYAGLHGLAFAGVIWNLVASRFNPSWHWLPYLALTASGFDYLENMMLTVAVDAWPYPTPELFWAAGRIFTPAKWIFAAITTALMLFGVAWWMVRKVRKSA